MAQRLLAFLLLQCIFVTTLLAAEAGDAKNQALKRTPEATFLEGQTCLQANDLACAQLSQNRIPPQSAYAKLLAGNIASAQGDFDQAFRLLLPLQANPSLTKPALASLHASLGLAYENQPDILRALEQYAKAADYVVEGKAIETNDQRIWQLLNRSSRGELIEIRGESYDTTIQGWIDLALAGQSLAEDPAAITNWRKAYPDHVARAFAKRQFGAELAGNATTSARQPASMEPKSVAAKQLKGPVALLLPFGVESFYPASDAIERGFVAAQSLHEDSNEVRLYPTNGDKEDIASIHAKAVSEGAVYVLGPLTRDESTTLATNSTGRVDNPVLTLALNQPESPATQPGFYSFGLSIESEVAQIVRLARNAGMQTVSIVSSGNPVAERTAKAFHDAWQNDGGEILMQTGPNDTKTLGEVREEIKARPADFIFLCANPEEARAIRPFLDAGTPTFGISHLYSGLAFDAADHVMNAVRFVDLPWIIDPDNAAFKGYRAAAAELPPGEMQRWFALGADAYALLLQLSASPTQAATINGLTGKLRVSPKGEVSRESAIGRFSPNGVVLEKSP
jgi:outer membrane PBP1 activator LpoA protein